MLVLVIGGGILAVLVFLLLQRGQSAPSAEPNKPLPHAPKVLEAPKAPAALSADEESQLEAIGTDIQRLARARRAA